MCIMEAIAIGGLVANVIGAKKQSDGTQAASTASKDAENAREQQMLLESARQQRETVRKMQLARAESLSTATNQGAKESSGLFGAQGSLVTQASSAINTIQRAEGLGQDIFRANRDYASAQETIAIGSGFQKFGTIAATNAPQIEKQLKSFGSMFGPSGWQTSTS